MLDAAGSGALPPSELEEWLLRRAPLAALTEQLVSEADWCTAIAARLLLLHGRRGRLPLKDLAASPHMNELSAVLHALEAAEAAVAAAATCDASGAGDGGRGESDRGTPSAGSCQSQGASAAAAAALAAAQQRLQGSWFSPAAAATLRARFAELDADGDGMLSEQEFPK